MCKNRMAVLFGGMALMVLTGSMRGGSSEGKEARELTCTGKVVDEQGRPIGGAKVSWYRIVYDESTRGTESRLAVETGTTTNDGGFSFTATAEDDSYQYGYIVVEKEGLALGFANWRMRQEDQELLVKLGQAKVLAGVVVDEGGKPVADANVSIWGLAVGEDEQQQGLSSVVAEKLFSVTTEASGRFAFAKIPAEATADFLVRKAGRATVCTFRSTGYAYQKMTFAPGQKDIKLVLAAEARIEGTVRAKDTGQPAVKVRLMLIQEMNRPAAGQKIIEPSKDGTFSVNALAAGSYTLQLVRPTEGPAEWVADPVNVTLEAGQTGKDVVIELIKGGLLDVHVSEAETGKPLPGASVNIRDNKNNRWVNARCGQDGIARIRLVPGVYELGGAYRQGFTSDEQQETITIESGVTKNAKRLLSPMPRITGVVRDETGKPVKGAKVQICPMGGQEVRSDAEGRFELNWNLARIRGEQRQTPLLVCRHVEANLASVIMLPDGATTCDVTLKPGVTISGKIADAQGRGIANARIRPMIRQTMWSSTITRDSIKTDAGGNFEIKAIPAEHEYNLGASAAGYGSKRVDITTDDAIDHTLRVQDIVLPVANLTVSGVVVDTRGKPLANARIESSDFGEGQPERLTTQADSKGSFTLAGVCEGKVNIRVSATLEGKPLSARAIAVGGARGLKIVAREGQPATQYFSTKTYEQIVQSTEKVIAGVAVDENGSPVAGVPVGVCCIKKKREDGKFSWSYSSYPDLKATTDAQGRFAIGLQEDAEYNLLFSPDNQAAIIVYDIPAGKKDLKVTLPEGGTVIGHLVRMEKGQKVPIPSVEIKIEQPDRASYTHLGFDRDRTAVTDAEGRFRFEHLQTLIRSDRLKPEYAARVWEIKYGDTSKSVAFYDGTTINDLELVVGDAAGEAQSVLGKPLPGFEGIKIDVAPDAGKDKPMLLCFFDMNQRPSRNCMQQLSKRTEELKAKGIVVLAVQASKVDQNTLDEWVKKNNVPFPVGMVQGDEEQTRFAWGVKSLPWLILTDKEHIVRAEGFALTELEEKVKEIDSGNSQSHKDSSSVNMLLENIRDQVIRNEESFNLIKVSYRSQFDYTIPKSELEVERYTNAGSRKTTGGTYSHTLGIWAQDGVKQHISLDSYYGPDDLAQSNVSVVNGEVLKWAIKPDFMEGGVGNMEDFRWSRIGPQHLGLRPLGLHKLSELLAPENAIIHAETELIGDREAYIIDAKRPIQEPPYYARIWIDCERYMPLKIQHYGFNNPSSSKSRPHSEVIGIKLHQLPNGGWFPVEGTHVSYRQEPRPHQRLSHIVVDANSITIQREDIPESLFEINFPEGARIHNAIPGTTAEQGKGESIIVERIVNDSTEESLPRRNDSDR